MGRRPVRGRATLAQVAERAAVSTATASRALSGQGRVAPETVAAIDRAARELGYRTARDDAGTVTAASRVGILIGGMRSQLSEGVVEAVLARTDTPGCVIAVTEGDAVRERQLLLGFLDDPAIRGVVVVGGTDGIGGTGPAPSDEPSLTQLVRRFADRGKRLVFCGRPPIDGRLPERVVDYDNRGGARMAATHLFSNGHREVLFVRGPEGFHASDARAAGFRDACAAVGVDRDPRLTRTASRDRRGGYAATRAALDDGIAFTAVLADCDWMGVGALAALADAGIDVPGTVSVMGFDDMWVSEDLRVPLTTVHIPYRDIGATAAEMVLGPDQPNRDLHRTIGTHLVIRDSVGPRA